jgi:hypothetical protein
MTRYAFRDSTRMVKPAATRTPRRTRDENSLGANMGRLNGPDGPPSLNQATASGDVPAPLWGGNTEHVISLPLPRERDPNGGGYVWKQNESGFHVGFMHGTEWNAGGSTNSGLVLKQMTPRAGAQDDHPPYDGRGRPDPKSVVENYVGSRINPQPTAGTQDGHALGKFANPTLVAMNKRNQKARVNDAWGSESTTVDRNSLTAQIDAKNRAFWKDRS